MIIMQTHESRCWHLAREMKLSQVKILAVVARYLVLVTYLLLRGYRRKVQLIRSVFALLQRSSWVSLGYQILILFAANDCFQVILSIIWIISKLDIISIRVDSSNFVWTTECVFSFCVRWFVIWWGPILLMVIGQKVTGKETWQIYFAGFQKNFQYYWCRI